MTKICYPDEAAVSAAIKDGDPLLVLISFDSGTAIMAHIDEAFEHHILLEKVGINSGLNGIQTKINKYFRIILDNEGADWTFVCPPDYKNIEDKQRRITAFYKDGFAAISDLLSGLGLMVGINIPKRYRRHFDYMMSE